MEIDLVLITKSPYLRKITKGKELARQEYSTTHVAVIIMQICADSTDKPITITLYASCHYYGHSEKLVTTSSTFFFLILSFFTMP